MRVLRQGLINSMLVGLGQKCRVEPHETDTSLPLEQRNIAGHLMACQNLDFDVAIKLEACTMSQARAQ